MWQEQQLRDRLRADEAEAMAEHQQQLMELMVSEVRSEMRQVRWALWGVATPPFSNLNHLTALKLLAVVLLAAVIGIVQPEEGGGGAGSVWRCAAVPSRACGSRAGGQAAGGA